MKINDIIDLAAAHAQQLSDDIRLAANRVEHIRVTARAQEAVNLLHHLQQLTATDDINDSISETE